MIAGLAIEGLGKRFGDIHAVRDISLAVPHGQMVGVIGRSGAGKSTLLRMINRLVEPDCGRIGFDGRDVSGLSGAALRRWRAECGMIFQQFRLIGQLDVLTNVLMGRASHRGPVPPLSKRFSVAERALAIAVLARLDIAPLWNQRADRLSGGQQQRVAIARALLQESRILLADEPISALDPKSAAIVMQALHGLCREDGMTVICNLHALDTARQYCDRVIGMSAGGIVFDGPPAALDGGALRLIYGETPHDAGPAAPAPSPCGLSLEEIPS